MAEQAWDRRGFTERDTLRDHALSAWLTGEVVPFNRFWAERIGDRQITGATDLAGLPVLEEAQAAGVGGPGNPGLLLLPTEDGFKRYASRAEIWSAARELRRGGAEARRAVLFRRYKPEHVHEAGVAALLAIAYTRSDLDRLHLAGARMAEVAGLGADDRLVNGVPPGPSVRFWGIYHAALAARMTALHPRTEGQDPAMAIARALTLLPATVLALPVAEAAAVLDGLADLKVRMPHLRTLLTVGPPPDAEQRAALGATVGALSGGAVRVQAVWAPESSRVLWAECRPPSADPGEATYGLHTYPDLEYLEVRDVAHDRPAGQGRPGELLVTSTGWRGTALVRFATGAWTGGLVTQAPCPNCGRTVPRLAPFAVEGAWQPRVVAGQRRVRVDLRRAHAVLRPATLERLGVRDWSLRAVDGVLTLGVDVAGGGTEGLADLARAVGDAVGAVPTVRVGRAAAAARPQVGDAG